MSDLQAHPALFTPPPPTQEDSWYQFQLEAESIPASQWGCKDYVVVNILNITPSTMKQESIIVICTCRYVVIAATKLFFQHNSVIYIPVENSSCARHSLRIPANRVHSLRHCAGDRDKACRFAGCYQSFAVENNLLRKFTQDFCPELFSENKVRTFQFPWKTMKILTICENIIPMYSVIRRHWLYNIYIYSKD
jgi:hypothetical protein